jgi:hypothetical protein
VAADRSRSPVVAHPRSSPTAARSGLSLAAQASISAAIGAREEAYWVHGSGSALTAQGAVPALAAHFGRASVRFGAGTREWALRLLGIGYGNSWRPVAATRPVASANRVVYDRGGLLEWYRNGPLGLEQGFTLQRALDSGSHPGPLTLSLAFAGAIRPDLSRDRRSLMLTRPGEPALRYAGLAATDATGRALHSWLELEHGRLLIRVDTRGARYPLRIDPLIQLGEKLTGAGESGAVGFGASVALSGDGETALIGAPSDSAGAGAVWIFTRSGATWTQQGPKISSPTEGASFGASVALSADGDTALIGGPKADSAQGAAWVYIRSGATWSRQAKLIASAAMTGTTQSLFGTSVALSANGETALVGEPGYTLEVEPIFPHEPPEAVGSAWVFTRAGAEWAKQGERLAGPKECDYGASCGGFGVSVALSARGETAIVGDEGEFEFTGSAWVYTHSSAGWTEQATLSARECGGLNCKTGISVALSADGDTALIGGIEAFAISGGAWVFTRSGSTWTQQASLGGNTICVTLDCRFGESVALAGDGTTALVGGPGNVEALGAAWAFERSGATWADNASKLTGTNEQGISELGRSVALSANGQTALVGGTGDSGGAGAVWVFGAPAPGVLSEGAAMVGVGSARLNGTVDAEGVASTAFFQYGTSSAYGQSTTVESAGSAEGGTPFAADVGGLAPETTYHFRIVAESSSGRSYGADETFTTGLVAPSNTALPAISGDAIRGLVLLASPGSWSSDPSTITYQWERCDIAGNSCRAVAGATAPVYTLGQADVGHRLRVSVQAGNAAGSAGAMSAVSAIVGSLVEASMTWTFAWARRYTEVRALAVQGIPAGGEVDVACHGRGCPFARDHVASVGKSCRASKCPKPRRPPGKAGTSIAGLFKGKRLGVGTRITVSVVKPGWIGKEYIFTTRAGKAPTVKTACVGVGSAKPGHGC